jgi:hypothetical protein
MAEKEGQAVYEQARDKTIANTEPLSLRGLIMSAVALIALVLVFNGLLTQDESDQLMDAVEKLLLALIAVAPFITALWGRLSVWSPKTAAGVAVQNVQAGFDAAQAGNARPEPTLAPPP